MKLKYYLLFSFMAATIFPCFVSSCSNDEPSGKDPEEENYVYKGSDHGITFNHQAYISPMIDGDIRTALNKCVPHQSASVDANTRLVMVKNLSEISEKNLVSAYNAGATIAVVDPIASDIKQWSESHPEWCIAYNSQTMDENSFVYYFDKDDYHGILNKTPLAVTMDEDGNYELDDSNDDNDVETIGDDTYGQYYSVLGSWIDQMNNRPVNNDSNSDNNGVPSIDALATEMHFSNYFPIVLDNKIRGGFSIKGTGGISITTDVTTLHVYEKTAQNDNCDGKGDYYLVSLTASVANGNMYMGKIHKVKKGVHYRLIGYICDSFNVTARLLNQNNAEVSDVIFPAGFTPLPITTSGSTHYESSQTFSINASGGWSQKDGANAGVNIGGQWSKSQSRDVKDVNITNTSIGAQPSWTLYFANTPKYSIGKIAFVEQNGVYSFRSTQYLFGQWVWCVPSAKDDVELPQKSLNIFGNVNYHASSFFTTKADLKTQNFTIPYSCSFVLPDPYKKTKGQIILHNNLDSFIRDIEIFDAQTDKIIHSLDDAYPSNTEINLGWFPVFKPNSQTERRKYGIRYTANGKTYTYSGKTLEMKDRQTRNLYCTEDFR